MRRSAPGSSARVWERLRRRRGAVVCALYLALLIAIAVFRGVLASDRPLVVRSDGRWIFRPPDISARAGTPSRTDFVIRSPVPYDPYAVDLIGRLRPPSRRHLPGTDALGRDVLARMIHGAAVSLTVGIAAAIFSLVLGSLLGAAAGYFGGKVDWLISRTIEVTVCFPFLFLVLAVVAFLGPSVATLILALGLTSWTTEARLIRAEILRVRQLEFTEAAKASGAGGIRIVLRHLLPNALPPVLVLVSFAVGSAILVESALSFLGLGVSLPVPSWGGILASAEDYLGRAWWLALFPGIAIFTTVAAWNVLGETLRDVLDPQQPLP